MFGWFRKKTKAPTVTISQAAPMTWEERHKKVNALHSEWQLAWHDAFDRDETLIALGEFARPHPIPTDLDGDYRLICGISQASKATRDVCFGIFPQGAEMAKRFDQYLTSTPQQMEEAEARKRLKTVLQIIQELGTDDPTDLTQVRIVDRDTDEGLSALRMADDISVLTESSGPLGKVDPAKNIAEGAASSFLSEPLYMSCGNYRYLREWVTAAIFGGEEEALDAELYTLWHGGWQVFLDDEGIILAKRAV